MPRSIWSGTISFGLVSIPVKLFTATASKTVHFHQLEEGTGERIERKRVSAGSGEEVDYDDIVKGYDLGEGRHVIVEPDELDSVDPGQQERIEIEDFVALADVDPIFFQKTYYVAPADAASAKSYELLRATMHDTERVAIARFVMRTKQYLATVRPASNILMLQTMFFSDEVRDPSAIEEMARSTATSNPRSGSSRLRRSSSSRSRPIGIPTATTTRTVNGYSTSSNAKPPATRSWTVMTPATVTPPM